MSDIPTETGNASSSFASNEDVSLSEGTSSLEEDHSMSIISFPSLPSLSPKELDAFIGSDIKTEDGSWNNDEHSNGVVLSPYYNLTINGEKTEAYGIRATEGMHSFALLSLSKGQSAECGLSFLSSSEISSFKVLPSSSKVGLRLNKNHFSFTVSKPGSYTAILNEDYAKAFTLFVYQKGNNPSAYEETIFSPGEHGLIAFSKEKQTYRFEKGVHRVDRIDFKSNCEVILEDGAMLIADVPSKSKEVPLLDPDWAGMTRYKAFFNAENCKNVAIKGHGLVDLTSLPWHARLGLYFSSCESITLNGFLMNGSPEWTLELFGCTQATVENIALFGYRQNSDGFAIVDSSHVEIRNCFARSGDDLFEVKTMDPNLDNEVKDIHFSSCVAWPDKCRGYGIIHETKRDISDVVYEDISIIKAPADWMDALGCLNVIVAGDASISAVSFKNVEINECSFYPINVSLLADSAKGSIHKVNFENINIPNDNPIRLLNASASGSVSEIFFHNIYRRGAKVQGLSSLSIKQEGSVNLVTLN